MVVRLDEGTEAVRAYVESQAARGRDHVVALVSTDLAATLALLDDLSEEEAGRVTPDDEWSVFRGMRHLAASLERSRERLETLSSGREYASSAGPPAAGATGGGPGGAGTAEYASFDELRSVYSSGMKAIVDVLCNAPDGGHLAPTADHVMFGSFNWLQWAVYSHHVHTHDHLDQLARIREAVVADRS